MPIERPPKFETLDQSRFTELTYRVRKAAFDSQNELGRLCDEIIYQNDILARIRDTGLAVEKHVPIHIKHQHFQKAYYLDLLVGNGAIIELKTVSTIIPRHYAQVLNYLYLCNARNGKLINLRTERVDVRFVNTTLDQHQRKTISLKFDDWKALSPTEKFFEEMLCSLFHDWGAGLEISLYREALVHLLGGEDTVTRPLPLTRNNIPLGYQNFDLILPDCAFVLSAVKHQKKQFIHLKSLLHSSPLKTLHWINIHGQKLECTTLTQ